MSSQLLQELSRKYPPLLNQKQYCELTGKAASTAEQDRLYGRGAPCMRNGSMANMVKLDGKGFTSGEEASGYGNTGVKAPCLKVTQRQIKNVPNIP